MRLRFNLDFGEIPIRTINFYRQDKMIAVFLRKLRELRQRYRLTTVLDPCIWISLNFRWQARSIYRLNAHYTRVRLPVDIDIDRWYKSLGDTLEQWNIELHGSQDSNERQNESKRGQSKESLIETNGPRPRDGYKKMGPELAAQIERAMDAMSAWQRVFAAPNEDCKASQSLESLHPTAC
jgi:hypothetical protein